MPLTKLDPSVGESPLCTWNTPPEVKIGQFLASSCRLCPEAAERVGVSKSPGDDPIRPLIPGRSFSNHRLDLWARLASELPGCTRSRGGIGAAGTLPLPRASRNQCGFNRQGPSPT